VRRFVRTKQRFAQAADFFNRNDSSKYSDRSAFKSLMTGVAGFSRWHLERLSAGSRAHYFTGRTRQAAIVGGDNTPYHLPGLKRIITGEIIATAATLFRWD
jgi:hypothetical protein